MHRTGQRRQLGDFCGGGPEALAQPSDESDAVFDGGRHCGEGLGEDPVDLGDDGTELGGAADEVSSRGHRVGSHPPGVLGA